MVNLSELKQAQAKLRDSEARYRMLFEGAGASIFLIQEDRFVDCNPVTLTMFGCTREQIIGATLDHFSPDYQPDGRLSHDKAREMIAAAFRGEAQSFEWRHQRHDGTPFDTEVTLNRVVIGETSQILATMRDITKRRKIEDALRASEEKLRGLYELSPLGIVLTDMKGRYLEFNEAFRQICGYPTEELKGLDYWTLTPRKYEAEEARQLETLTNTGRYGPYEKEYVRKDGNLIPLRLNGVLVMGRDGEHYIWSIVEDITERKRVDAELVQSREILIERNESLRLINQLSLRLHGSLALDDIMGEVMEALLGMARTPHVAIYLLGESKQELRLTASHGFENKIQELGKTLPLSGSLSGMALADKGLLVSQDIVGDERLEPSIRAALLAAGIRSGLVIPMTYQDQPIGTINLMFEQRQDFSDMELETLGAFSNTVALAIANARHLQRLAFQVSHDSLTGLANRSVLHEQFMRYVQPWSESHAALILLDLDRFKEINDTLGHHVGDRLLTEIGPRLEEVFVEQRVLICRLGGDEFAVLLTGLAEVSDAVGEVKRVAEALKGPFIVEGMALQIGASAGVAYYPQHGGDSHALLRAADVAMYQAKTMATGVAVYDRAYDPHSPERLALATELVQAVERGQLVLHYQPKKDLASGEVIGFEALVRWQHPRLGLLYPDSFLHLVEMNEVIHPFTRAVMDLTMADKRRLHDEGHYQPVAINLSVRNLMDARCISNLEQLFNKHALPHEEIELELTETALMHDPDRAIALLKEITAMGVGVAIDDFGTGYSSLAYLRRLPIKALKIDRSFVMGMYDNVQDDIIVRSTITLAHNLGLKVIAEGVENARVLDLLRSMGCDQAQGYHLCEPLSFDALHDWLTTICQMGCA